MTLFGTTLPGYLLLKFQGRSGSCFDVSTCFFVVFI